MRRTQFTLPEAPRVLNPEKWQHPPLTTGGTTTRAAGGWEGKWKLLFSVLDGASTLSTSPARSARLAPLKAKAGVVHFSSASTEAGS